MSLAHLLDVVGEHASEIRLSEAEDGNVANVAVIASSTHAAAFRVADDLAPSVLLERALVEAAGWLTAHGVLIKLDPPNRDRELVAAVAELIETLATALIIEVEPGGAGVIRTGSSVSAAACRLVEVMSLWRAAEVPG